jgi:hypothetical protein
MGSCSFAKVPKIADRIRETHSEEKGETYIELITDRERDDQTGEIREKTVRIGTDLGRLLPGMMAISDEYHNYFDLKGNLIYDPLGRKEAEEREKAKAEAEKKAAEQARAEAEKKAAEQAAREKEPAKQVPQKTVKTVRGAERTVDEIRESLLQKERELEEKPSRAKGRNEAITSQAPDSALGKLVDKVTGKEAKRQDQLQQNEKVSAQADSDVAKLKQSIAEAQSMLDDVDAKLDTVSEMQQEASRIKAKAESAYAENKDVIDKAVYYAKTGADFLSQWFTK